MASIAQPRQQQQQQRRGEGMQATRNRPPQAIRPPAAHVPRQMDENYQQV
jgi:hypothetical protein